MSPEGVVVAFGLAPANCDERPVGEFLVTTDGHGGFLADKGFSSARWERHWLEANGSVVAAYTCGQVLNNRLGRPLRHLASLLI